MNGTTEVITSRISFASLFIADFLQGALFLLFNGPILFAFIITGAVPFGLLDSYKIAIMFAAAHVSSTETQFIWITIFIVTCIVLSQAVRPLGRVIGIFCCYRLKREGYRGFSSYDYIEKQYPKFLARLMRDPIAKEHWEWELFLFYQRRNAVASFLVWLALLICMRCVHWGPYFNILYLLELLISLSILIGSWVTFKQGSKIMWQTHIEYVDLPELPYRLSKNSSITIAISNEELSELKGILNHSIEDLGIDARMIKNNDKRIISLFPSNLCLLIDLLEIVMANKKNYPDRNANEYKTIKILYGRLVEEYQKRLNKR